MASPLLEVRNLKKSFPVKEGLLMRAKKFNQAVDDVSLFIQPGETLGLVGESGCGKSTLGRCIVKLYQPDQGQILFNGTDINTQSRTEKKQHHKSVQMIFQDPLESLNSRHTIEQILTEPFAIHQIGDRKWRLKRIQTLLDLVGLPSNSTSRYPFEFSGGQRQRIGIARAIALGPELIVCDEAVSALDVSIQSQIINLLLDLQSEFNIAYLFISHSIPVADPHHKNKRLILKGDIPSSINPPSGCHFHTRCPEVMPCCKVDEPKVIAQTSSHSFSCHLN
jgi:oligopeptide/dipeptide ABC transporter ATP-binding protein